MSPRPPRLLNRPRRLTSLLVLASTIATGVGATSAVASTPGAPPVSVVSVAPVAAPDSTGPTKGGSSPASTGAGDLMAPASERATATTTISDQLHAYLVDGLGVDVGPTSQLTGVRTGAKVTLSLTPRVPASALPDGPTDAFDRADVVVDARHDTLTLHLGSSTQVDDTLDLRVAHASTTHLAPADLHGVTRLHVSALGADVVMKGRVGAAAGQPAISARGVLPGDVATADVVLRSRAALTLTTADGLRFDGRARLGDPQHALDVRAAGHLPASGDFVLAVSARKGASSWRPVRGLRVRPSFTGTIERQEGVTRFDVSADASTRWSATSHVALAVRHIEFADRLPDAAHSCPTAVNDGEPWFVVTGATRIPAGEAGTFAGVGSLCVQPATGDGYLAVERAEPFLLEKRPVPLTLRAVTLHGPVSVHDGRTGPQLAGVAQLTAGADPAAATTTHAAIELTAAGPIVVDFRGDPSVMAMDDSHDHADMQWVSAPLVGYHDQVTGEDMTMPKGMSMAADPAPAAPTAIRATSTPPVTGDASAEPASPIHATLLAAHRSAAAVAPTSTTAPPTTVAAVPTTMPPATKATNATPKVPKGATPTTTSTAAAATTTTVPPAPSTTAMPPTPLAAPVPNRTSTLSSAVVDFLARNLHIALGSGDVSGTLADGVLTVSLGAPSGLPITLPGDAGTLTFGPTTLEIDTAADTATFHARGTAGSGIGADLRVVVTHPATTSLSGGTDLNATLAVTSVPVLGTTVDLSGTLSLINGAFSAALTGKLAADAPIVAGVVLQKDTTFTLDRATGLQLAGSMLVGPDGAPNLTVAVAGTFARLQDWSLTVSAQPGAKSWSPVPDLSIAPAVSGTLTRAAGRTSFDLTVTQPASWQPTPDLSFAVSRFEISNGAPPSTVSCPDVTEGTLWVDAAGTLAYAPANAMLTVETCLNPATRRFTTSTTVTTDHLLPAGAGFDLTAAGLTVSGDVAARTFRVVGGATVAVPTSGGGQLQVPIALSFGSDRAVIGAVTLPDLHQLDPSLTGAGTLFVSTTDEKGFDPTATFPSLPKLAPFDLRRGIDAVFSTTLGAGVADGLGRLGLVASPTVQVVASVTTAGVRVSLDLAFGAGTSGARLFSTDKGAAVYLNGGSLTFSVGASNAMALSATGTLVMPSMAPGASASQVTVTLSGAFDFSTLKVSLGFDLTGTCGTSTCPWQNAFGIHGMAVDQLGGTLGIDFATAVPTPSASFAARNLVLPPSWASAIGMVPGTAISFAANLDAAQPVLAIDLQGNPVALTPLAMATRDPSVRGSFEIGHASLLLAPFGGTTATHDMLDPGVALVFDGTVLRTPVHVAAKVGLVPPHIDADAHFGPLQIGSARFADTRLAIHAGTDGFGFTFTGGFTDGRGTSFAASVMLNATTQLQGATIQLTGNAGLPGYLTVTGALTGSISTGAGNVPTFSVAGYAALDIGSQHFGYVQVSYSLDTGAAWQQLGQDAQAVASAFQSAYGWSAQTLAQTMGQLQYSATQTYAAMQAIGVQAQALIDAFVNIFHSGRYYLWSNDGQVLDVANASTSPGGGVVQWLWNGGRNQQWTSVPTDSGWVELVSVNSGLCLTVNNVDNTPGELLIQWPCTGMLGQQWQLPSGTGTIWNRQSLQVIDIPGASIKPGKQLEQWPYNGGWNQQFHSSPA